MSPLFCEMEELQQALDEEEFVDALGRLYESIPAPTKEKLLLKPDAYSKQLKNAVKHAPEYDFKPKINEASQRMARERNTGSQADVSNRLYKHSVER